MSKYINLIKDKLILSFKYDPNIISVIRTIDGRQWNPKDKRWEVPKENVLETLEALKPFNFTTHIDVLNLKREQEKFLIEIENIRNDSTPYSGTLPLYDFQKTGAMFLRNMPATLLGDVPGLGKSIQAIAATENDDFPQVLIFCPSSLKFSWKEEIMKWIPDAKIHVINGNKKQRMEQWINAKTYKPKYVIANYELLIYDFDLIKDYEWPAIICDEATRISNPGAESVKNLKTLKSKKRIALTGTPISNSPDDIFSIIDWLVPRYLGTYYQFKQKYCITGEYDKVVGYQKIDELSAKVNRFMLRRMKEEVMKDLPPKTIETIVIEMSEKERELYDSVRNLLWDEIKKMSDLDTRSLAIIPVKMLRLKQCTGHTKLIKAEGEGESSKMDTLKEMLGPIIKSGEKAIVFTQFSGMLAILAEALAEFRPMTIWGEVDSEEKMRRVKEFNDDSAGRVIIMTEAGAYGLNMQSASYVFHYDAPWSIAKLMQREDRAHRNGQKKPVTVYNMVVKDSIDEYVHKVLHRKQKVSVNILQDADRLEAQGLTMDDIHAILRI